MLNLKHLVRIRALALNRVSIKNSFQEFHSLARSREIPVSANYEYNKLLSVTSRTAFTANHKIQIPVNIDELTEVAPKRLPDDSITFTMTPELEEQICGDNLGKKYILKNALLHITLLGKMDHKKRVSSPRLFLYK